MRTKGTVTLATRGSDLARQQAKLVGEALENRRLEAQLETVDTTGDQLRDELIHRLGTTGAFVRELDERVLDGSVDGAVHSMKDMPTEQPDDLVTAAVPERAQPGDVLVTPDGTSLEDLSEGAVVGTASLRRRAQVLARRPDLTVEPIRGNVDTRVEKVLAPALVTELEDRRAADAERRGDASEPDKPTDDDNDAVAAGEDAPSDDSGNDHRTVDDWHANLSGLETRALDRGRQPADDAVAYDALVMAEAGIRRAGLDEYVECERLPLTEFVPAPGQGALAVTAADGETARQLHEVLDHPRSRVETTVERTILAELGGGCIAPIGIYAVVQGEYVHVRVQVFDRDGETSVTGTRDVPIERHASEAREFARTLADRGAAELIAEARRADAGVEADGQETADEQPAARDTEDETEDTDA